jgi:FkbM family methyltransferase
VADASGVGRAPLRVLRALRQNSTVNAGLQRTLGAALWRERLPPTIWKRVPIYGEFRVAVPGTNGFRYLARGEPLGKTLFWRGIAGFEPGSAKVFCELARTASVLLDVGAYSGYYTLLASSVNRECQSHCFEPVPAIRAWLSRNFELNGLEDCARIVPSAVSEIDATEVSFYASQNVYSPGGSLLREFGREERVAFRSSTLTLDAYVQAQGLTSVGLVKIDTEGAEPKVLQGARRLLETQRPFIMCEILDDDAGHIERIEQLLHSLDYRHAHITEQGLVRRRRIAPDPARRLRNFLLWPAERALAAELAPLET